MSDQDEFVVRADREGTPVDVSELRENPFQRRAQPRSMLRALGSSRGLGAAALAVAVLILGWKLAPRAPSALTAIAPTPAPVSTNGVVHLEAADPQSLRSQIIEQLRAAGTQAFGYDQPGVHGIIAELPRPVPEGVVKVLQDHGIPVPGDGALRIQISAR
ncbi:MAG TPA: hypothetical protein VGE96_03345 [Steroidobacteraceae bacterium]|jgi:hypothetical protein